MVAVFKTQQHAAEATLPPENNDRRHFLTSPGLQQHFILIRNVSYIRSLHRTSSNTQQTHTNRSEGCHGNGVEQKLVTALRNKLTGLRGGGVLCLSGV